MRITWLNRWRVVISLGLVFALAGSAWAEYCQRQGDPALPRDQVGRFDWRASLDTAEIVTSEAEPHSRVPALVYIRYAGYEISYIPRKMGHSVCRSLDASWCDAMLYFRGRPFREGHIFAHTMQTRLSSSISELRSVCPPSLTCLCIDEDHTVLLNFRKAAHFENRVQRPLPSDVVERDGHTSLYIFARHDVPPTLLC